MTCKACGQPYGCDHSDAEYQGGVPRREALIETARRIVVENLSLESHRFCKCREQIASGAWDRGHAMRSTIAALERAGH